MHRCLVIVLKGYGSVAAWYGNGLKRVRDVFMLDELQEKCPAKTVREIEALLEAAGYGDPPIDEKQNWQAFLNWLTDLDEIIMVEPLAPGADGSARVWHAYPKPEADEEGEA